MALRDVLNQTNPNNTFSALRQIGLGDLLNLLLKALTVTESGVTVTSNIATLANAPNPNSFYAAKATTATTTGYKEIIRGTISGSTVTPVPATGQCVWDGNLKVAFAAADVVSVASFTYESAADTAVVSCLQNQLGNQTSP